MVEDNKARSASLTEPLLGGDTVVSSSVPPEPFSPTTGSPNTPVLWDEENHSDSDDDPELIVISEPPKSASKKANSSNKKANSSKPFTVPNLLAFLPKELRYFIFAPIYAVIFAIRDLWSRNHLTPILKAAVGGAYIARLVGAVLSLVGAIVFVVMASSISSVFAGGAGLALAIVIAHIGAALIRTAVEIGAQLRIRANIRKLPGYGSYDFDLRQRIATQAFYGSVPFLSKIEVEDLTFALELEKLGRKRIEENWQRKNDLNAYRSSSRKDVLQEGRKVIEERLLAKGIPSTPENRINEVLSSKGKLSWEKLYDTVPPKVSTFWFKGLASVVILAIAGLVLGFGMYGASYISLPEGSFLKDGLLGMQYAPIILMTIGAAFLANVLIRILKAAPAKTPSNEVIQRADKGRKIIERWNRSVDVTALQHDAQLYLDKAEKNLAFNVQEKFKNYPLFKRAQEHYFLMTTSKGALEAKQSMEQRIRRDESELSGIAHDVNTDRNSDPENRLEEEVNAAEARSRSSSISLPAGVNDVKESKTAADRYRASIANDLAALEEGIKLREVPNVDQGDFAPPQEEVEEVAEAAEFFRDKVLRRSLYLRSIIYYGAEMVNPAKHHQSVLTHPPLGMDPHPAQRDFDFLNTMPRERNARNQWASAHRLQLLQIFTRLTHVQEPRSADGTILSSTPETLFDPTHKPAVSPRQRNAFFFFAGLFLAACVTILFLILTGHTFDSGFGVGAGVYLPLAVAAGVLSVYLGKEGLAATQGGVKGEQATYTGAAAIISWTLLVLSLVTIGIGTAHGLSLSLIWYSIVAAATFLSTWATVVLQRSASKYANKSSIDRLVERITDSSYTPKELKTRVAIYSLLTAIAIALPIAFNFSVGGIVLMALAGLASASAAVYYTYYAVNYSKGKRLPYNKYDTSENRLNWFKTALSVGCLFIAFLCAATFFNLSQLGPVAGGGGISGMGDYVYSLIMQAIGFKDAAAIGVPWLASMGITIFTASLLSGLLLLRSVISTYLSSIKDVEKNYIRRKVISVILKLLFTVGMVGVLYGVFGSGGFIASAGQGTLLFAFTWVVTVMTFFTGNASFKWIGMSLDRARSSVNNVPSQPGRELNAQKAEKMERFYNRWFGTAAIKGRFSKSEKFLRYVIREILVWILLFLPSLIAIGNEGGQLREIAHVYLWGAVVAVLFRVVLVVWNMWSHNPTPVMIHNIKAGELPVPQPPLPRLPENIQQVRLGLQQDDVPIPQVVQDNELVAADIDPAPAVPDIGNSPDSKEVSDLKIVDVSDSRPKTVEDFRKQFKTPIVEKIQYYIAGFILQTDLRLAVLKDSRAIARLQAIMGHVAEVKAAIANLGEVQDAVAAEKALCDLRDLFKDKELVTRLLQGASGTKKQDIAAFMRLLHYPGAIEGCIALRKLGLAQQRIKPAELNGLRESLTTLTDAQFGITQQVVDAIAAYTVYREEWETTLPPQEVKQSLRLQPFVDETAFVDETKAVRHYKPANDGQSLVSDDEKPQPFNHQGFVDRLGFPYLIDRLQQVSRDLQANFIAMGIQKELDEAVAAQKKADSAASRLMGSDPAGEAERNAGNVANNAAKEQAKERLIAAIAARERARAQFANPADLGKIDSRAKKQAEIVLAAARCGNWLVSNAANARNAHAQFLCVPSTAKPYGLAGYNAVVAVRKEFLGTPVVNVWEARENKEEKEHKGVVKPSSTPVPLIATSARRPALPPSSTMGRVNSALTASTTPPATRSVLATSSSFDSKSIAGGAGLSPPVYSTPVRGDAEGESKRLATPSSVVSPAVAVGARGEELVISLDQLAPNSLNTVATTGQFLCADEDSVYVQIKLVAEILPASSSIPHSIGSVVTVKIPKAEAVKEVHAKPLLIEMLVRKLTYLLHCMESDINNNWASGSPTAATSRDQALSFIHFWKTNPRMIGAYAVSIADSIYSARENASMVATFDFENFVNGLTFEQIFGPGNKYLSKAAESAVVVGSGLALTSGAIQRFRESNCYTANIIMPMPNFAGSAPQVGAGRADTVSAVVATGGTVTPPATTGRRASVTANIGATFHATSSSQAATTTSSATAATSGSSITSRSATDFSAIPDL